MDGGPDVVDAALDATLDASGPDATAADAAQEGGACGLNESLCDGTCVTGECIVTPLARPNAINLNGPQNIVDDTANVYTAYGDGAIYAIPKDGSAPRLLATDTPGNPGPLGITVDSTYVYWTNYTEGTVSRVPISGGAATVLASNQCDPTGMTTTPAGVVWVNACLSQANTGQLVLLPNSAAGVPDAGAPIVLVDKQDYPNDITSDGTNIYWTNQLTTDGTGGKVMKVPIAGGAPTVIASGMKDHPNRIAVQANDLLVSTYLGDVYRIDQTTGARHALTTGNGFSGVAVRGANAYWVHEAPGVVYSMTLADENINALAVDTPQLGLVLVDDSFAYITSSGRGAVLRVPVRK